MNVLWDAEGNWGESFDSIADGILCLYPLCFLVAQLATVLDSGGNAEFRQDIGLQQEPEYENTDQPPNTHVFTPSLWEGFEIRPAE